MANKWVQFVKDWAASHNETYMCAATKPEVREAYRSKYGVAKKVSQKKERETMGAEDKMSSSVRTERKQEATERNMMATQDFNVKTPVAELPPPPKVSTLEPKKIVGSNAKKVFDMPELAQRIEEFKNDLPDIDSKLLKKIMLEWIDNFVKIRGKNILVGLKDWLNQPPQKIYQDFKIMYDLFKNKKEARSDLPKFSFKNPNFTPKNLLDFVNEKIQEEKIEEFGEFKIGEEVLIGKDLVKITKVEPKSVLVRYDNPNKEGSYMNDYRSTTYGTYPRLFKGKSVVIKNKDRIKKLPEDYNYEWSRTIDMGG